METVVDLVPARQEHSGLQKKVEKPISSHRWPPVVRNSGDSSRLDQEVGIRTNDVVESETPKPGKSFLSDSGYSTESPSMTSPAEVVRVYATPSVTSRPFIPCFKASVSAKPIAQNSSRVLFPPSKPVRPTFAPHTIKNARPVSSTETSSSLGSSTSNLPSFANSAPIPKTSLPNFTNSTPIPKTILPNFGSGMSKAKLFTQPPHSSQILPPISSELMKPLFSMPKPILAPKPKPAKKDGPAKKESAAQKRKSGLNFNSKNLHQNVSFMTSITKLNLSVRCKYCIFYIDSSSS